MAKLKRLKINKFRNVEPVELHFSDGFNVLLGINGSGKTTLLELIAALLSRDLSTIEDEEFSVEYRIAFESAVVEVVLENRLRRSEPVVAMGRRALTKVENEHDLLVKLRIREHSAPEEDAEEDWRDIPDDEFGGSPWSLGIQNRGICESMETLERISRFDESIDFFRSLFSNDDVQRFITAVGDLEDEASALFFAYPRQKVSRALMTALSEESKGQWSKWREPKSFRFSTEHLPFLFEMIRLAGLKDGWLDLRLLMTHKNVAESVMYQGFGDMEFWFERQDGSRVRADKLSHGQKRLLAFLYYLDCNPHIVIADELTNSLHHAWITACLQAIGDRQAFLANQDPLLLDELEFSSAEDVKRAFILCRCDTSSGKERLIWSNMSDYDAERFFEAYNVGLQHVSEILRDKNLW
ncbi:AAA family ATPase [Polyangium sorediatum]|uniref:AAA family ATPase n=1 Tax=Polyangium sorediatum TaxID=889274 RepID=A0ABT6NM42_9BACT|nr:AAA family ATPase [Polyangium sorediatum]MDI1429382.1 AAA family ATPase [Polyangium sorediatum]